VDFYLIRHGQSEGNAAGVFQGRGEYLLSETGRLQAAARGKALKAILSEPEKIRLFSSPQQRARETALVISREAGFPEPVYLDDLIEMELGIWAGKSWNEVKNNEPVLWAQFQARSWDVIPGAESSTALYNRALKVWAALCEDANRSKADKMVVVTHGGVLQWLVKSSFQSKSWFPLLPISNCGLFRFRVEPHPKEESAGLYWEEINSPLPDYSEPRGFPS